MEWSKQFEVGHKRVDEQHEKLVRKLNDLIEMSKNCDNIENFNTSLELLESYCLLHFSTEENIMIKNNYPMFKKHKEQHENFILAMNEFKEEFEKNGKTKKILEKMEEYCIYWLKGHIAGSDKEIQSYINKNNL